MSDLQGTEMLALRQDVVATVLQGGAVLLDLDTKYFYSVNMSGWAIVQLFESGSSCNQVQIKCRAWGAAPADADAILQFLHALIDERLVEAIAEAPPDQPVELAVPWSRPTIEKHKEPLQRIITSAFDPSLPLAE
jgi:hypothetical protein